MRPGFYEQTGRVEDDHWWFVHRRELVVELLERLGWGSQARVAARSCAGLDVGCGTGGNLSTLQRLGCTTVVGVDRSENAIQMAVAKHPGGILVQAEAGQLGNCFTADSFNLVCILNVLYHRWIDDEGVVLDQVERILAPGGWLVVTEPAFPFLYRRHDRLDYGARRYRRGGLARLIERSGFRILGSTYFNLPAFLPAAVGAMIDRARPERRRSRAGDETSELAIPTQPLNKLMGAACAVERKLITRFGRLPLGVGVLAVARKAPRP